MPKLPMFTATGRNVVSPREPGVLQLPNQSGEAYGTDAFRSLTQFGSTLMQAGEKLQQQRDELELVDRASAFDVGIKDDQQQALLEPDREKQPLKLKEYLDARRKTLEEGASPAVKRALAMHQGRQFPKAVLDMQTEGLHQMKDENDAMMERVFRQKAIDLPKITDPAERVRVTTEVRDLLNRSVKSRLMTEKDAETRWTKFQHDALEGEMEYLRQTDRSRLREMDRNGAFHDLDPNKRLKILAQANTDQEHEEIQREKNFKKVQDAAEWYWSSLANQGLLSGAQLQSALSGNDPYITPDKAREYQRINDNPPSDDANIPVRAVMQDYHSGPSSTNRIATTRKALNELARSLGRPSKVLDAALNELQTDERTERNVQAAELTAGIKFAEDKVKAESPPALPGRIGQMQKNMDEAEKAEMRNQIRKGKKPEDAAKEILERHKKAKEDVPERQKGLLDLVK